MTRVLICVALTFLAFSVSAADIKMSQSGLCHTPESSHYSRTKNYTAYSSLKACLDAGGKLPKGVVSHQPHSTAGDYDRYYFGHGWSDDDGDCQNARMEALIAQSVSPVKFATDKQCRVTSGTWNSMFTGDTMFDASKIDIDHVVPLKWAWEHGAEQWPKSQRIKFANDPVNLIAVEASLNRQKGAKGPSEWLPPRNQCKYVARFLRIAKSYKLQIPSNYEEVKQKHCSLKHNKVAIGAFFISNGKVVLWP